MKYTAQEFSNEKLDLLKKKGVCIHMIIWIILKNLMTKISHQNRIF